MATAREFEEARSVPLPTEPDHQSVLLASSLERYFDRLLHIEITRATNEEARNEKADVRELERQLIKTTTICDGSSPQSVRDWINEIEIIRPQAQSNSARPESLMIIVTQTITGSLRREIERFLITYCDREGCRRLRVPWPVVRDHIRKSYLSINEDAYLREQVQNVKQSPYETIANFTRRFRDAAEAAYPVDSRNEDQNRILLEAFGRGLSNDEVALEVLQRGQPVDLDRAIELALSTERGVQEFLRIRRGERAMEIASVGGAQTPATQRSAPNSEILKAVEGLQRTSEKIHTRLAKLELQQQRDKSAHGSGRRKGIKSNPTQSWTSDGRPICLLCGKAGHMKRDCWQNNKMPPSGKTRQNQQSGN
jgi:hypothetical protein